MGEGVDPGPGSSVPPAAQAMSRGRRGQRMQVSTVLAKGEVAFYDALRDEIETPQRDDPPTCDLEILWRPGSPQHLCHSPQKWDPGEGALMPPAPGAHPEHTRKAPLHLLTTRHSPRGAGPRALGGVLPADSLGLSHPF